MKLLLIRSVLSVLATLFTFALSAQSGWIEGVVMDKEYNETLPGAAVQIDGTTIGVVTDFDGFYKLEQLAPGKYTLRFSYISYASQEVKDIEVKAGQPTRVDISLGKANLQLSEVVVTGRRNMESENALLLERKLSTVAVESMGAREMSVKGISNVEDGVKKITGISVAGGNQVFVRGLGDRYSSTTMNGLTIASPNPDNKLIPLTLFPSSVVKNITVSKVYQPSSFGDYAGAHIDIETKENVGKDYLSISVSTGGVVGTMFNDFYSSDKTGVPYLGYSSGMKLTESIKDMSTSDFNRLKKNPFNTTFNIAKQQAIPELGLSISGGKSFDVAGNPLNVSLSANYSNGYTFYEDAYNSTLNAQGMKLDEFTSDKWLYETTLSGLAQVNYSIGSRHRLAYNLLYVNSTEDTYSDREGYDAEGVELVASNSVYRIYNLINNQLIGNHTLNDKLDMTWKASYGFTSSDEPDRRQVMYLKTPNGLELFKLNQQETSRYFGELTEDELVGRVDFNYLLGGTEKASNRLKFGAAYRQKSRDFYSANFYYNFKGFDPAISDVYNPDFISDSNLANGSYTIRKVSLPRNSYFADNKVMAGFVEAEYYLLPKLLLSGGLRYEYANQTVRYWNDAGKELTAELISNDLFPALNLKYDLRDTQNLRFSASRTVTRPSFIEMAPFEYKESYGGSAVRGYADLENGYNYNVDMRYEYYPSAGELISLSAYYKYLDNPIERVQEYAGSAIQTFRNVDGGQVAGLEVELRKNLVKDLKFGVNASYIYTRMELPKDGVYTDKKRQLQGASPYLINADIMWAPKFKNDRSMSLSLIYNLRGPRIHTVGINGVGNVVENAFNTLDFVGTYNINSKASIKFQAKNIINQDQKYTQEVSDTGSTEVVEVFQRGTKVEVGFSYNF
ncbi:MAG: TonB-dependent receptor domain-containing protein [Bacteroidales bacterium]